jgi:hypothetical protein
MENLSQLESHLWEAANILCGPVDAADFKTDVFPLLFFKRISTFTHPDTNVRMRVNNGVLDVEEFGSVYESLLELRPRIIPEGAKISFSYAQLAVNERKTTGSYYTQDSLVQCLLDSALDLVVVTDSNEPLTI